MKVSNKNMFRKLELEQKPCIFPEWSIGQSILSKWPIKFVRCRVVLLEFTVHFSFVSLLYACNCLPLICRVSVSGRVCWWCGAVAVSNKISKRYQHIYLCNETHTIGNQDQYNDRKVSGSGSYSLASHTIPEKYGYLGI